LALISDVPRLRAVVAAHALAAGADRAAPRPAGPRLHERSPLRCVAVSAGNDKRAVLARLWPRLAGHTSPETRAAVLELATGIHADVGGALAEVAGLRARLARELRPLGLAAAAAGTYPLASPGDTPVSGSPRYRMVADSMRLLARRDPTLALHVHVGVPDPENAIRVLNGLRGAVRCCWRCRPTLRSAKGATRGSRRRAR